MDEDLRVRRLQMNWDCPYILQNDIRRYLLFKEYFTVDQGKVKEILEKILISFQKLTLNKNFDHNSVFVQKNVFMIK